MLNLILHLYLYIFLCICTCIFLCICICFFLDVQDSRGAQFCSFHLSSSGSSIRPKWHSRCCLYLYQQVNFKSFSTPFLFFSYIVTKFTTLQQISWNNFCKKVFSTPLDGSSRAQRFSAQFYLQRNECVSQTYHFIMWLRGLKMKIHLIADLPPTMVDGNCPLGLRILSQFPSTLLPEGCLHFAFIWNPCGYLLHD